MSTLTGLSARQLQTIERSCGLAQGGSVLDVGCGAGEWIGQLRRSGFNATGVDDVSSGASIEGVLRIAIAANLSIPVHSQDVAIIRGTQVFSAPASTPETTIGLANVLSTIKPGGRLIVAVADETQAAALWQERLKPFQLNGALRTRGTGLLAWLTLAPILRPGGAVTVLEFHLGTEPRSRLEWHRLAREAVMPRKKPAAA